ncbi:thiamine-phosphate synthase family protein [uncultured Methanospirillum sp.]|uniref:thiamine-phosphate synthase family protein n=1 Tax=uncultured Methanospirillum sp. TaxID=262503 RepID=UPI0029C82846|nr:thiamine-phosphate synthase family protein [uncultured Methanospirillum sp.]
MNYTHESGEKEMHPSGDNSCGNTLIIRELEAVLPVLNEISHPLIGPARGISMAYARQGARTTGDTAAISEGTVIIAADLPVCRMTLTAIRFDPAIRCAAVLPYDPQIITAAEAMLMEVTTFNRAQEPPGDPTHDWGVAFCCEKSEGVPDVIYDLGYAEKDPLIRIFGENPTRVLANINRILSRIINTKFTEE